MPFVKHSLFLIIKFLVTTNKDLIQFNVTTLYLSGINAITSLFIRTAYLYWAMLRNTINNQYLFCFHLTFERNPPYTRKKININENTLKSSGLKCALGIISLKCSWILWIQHLFLSIEFKFIFRSPSSIVHIQSL